MRKKKISIVPRGFLWSELNHLSNKGTLITKLKNYKNVKNKYSMKSVRTSMSLVRKQKPNLYWVLISSCFSAYILCRSMKDRKCAVISYHRKGIESIWLL